MRRVTSVSTPVAHLVGPGKLKVINGQLAYTAVEQGPVRLDPGTLRGLYCYGGVSVSDEALVLLWRHRVGVAWLSAGGQRCLGRLAGSDASSTYLRLLQYACLADAEWRREHARGVVTAKVQSQLEAARHYQRHGQLTGATMERLRRRLDECGRASTVEGVRGVEGAATATWFGVLGELLRAPWRFTQRLRRPPPDPVNALLSLGYTFLLTRTVTLCEAEGLEANLGGLHAFRPGRPSLGCDVMEPWRVPAVDRWVVGVCNGGTLSEGDFESAEGGGMRLRPGVFGRMIHSWDDHWINGGHEKAMLDAVTSLVQRIRRDGPVLLTGRAGDMEVEEFPEEAGTG